MSVNVYPSISVLVCKAAVFSKVYFFLQNIDYKYSRLGEAVLRYIYYSSTF